METLKEEIRSRADIVDIIGRVVKLQKAGASHKGLCPFHQEKTPSFHVDSRKQSYYCFGCQSGGDVFNFVMEYEHVDFMGAMERLAQQTGVPFELDGNSGGHKGPKKDRLYAIHEQVTAWYEEVLHENAIGEIARKYVEKRQLDDEIVRAFRVGYSPDSFSSLLERLRAAEFTDEEIEASGLVGVREEARDGESYYDRFRGRLMFPIRDELSRVIGFSGRVLDPAQSKAKYVNSPETLLFKKSRVLYGIDRARASISAKRQALLCEGQLDVIRCHASGLDHAVAAQGTAITEEHARVLKRYADEVILLLDADAAGVKAALRSAEALLQCGLVLRVASVPEGEDPDSLVIRKGPKALQKVVRDALPFIEFQVGALLQNEPEINETSRMRVIRAVVETIGMAPEAAHREELIQQAASCLGVRPDALRGDVRPVQTAGHKPPSQLRPPSPASAPKRAARPQVDRLPQREELLIEVLCQHPELIPACKTHLRAEHLVHPDSQAIVEALYGIEGATESDIQDVMREHPQRARVQELRMRNPNRVLSEAVPPPQALEQLILLLREDALKRKQEELQLRHVHGSAETRSELESDIWQLTMVVRKLRECRMSNDWAAATTILEMYP
ncbi:MAG: DNA primase [Verrucomicrobia bacterium]|nr:DNA primase [Verrucomicrobiota bacterium]MCH8511457.1 DNA primase [Kiritimatiellia bacterium]